MDEFEENRVKAFADLFLPKECPNGPNIYLFTVCDEFADYVKHNNYNSFYHLEGKFKYIADVDKFSGQQLHEEILKSLEGECVLGIFVLKQNASIDFAKITDNKIAISVYYVSPSIKDIYTNNTAADNGESYSISTVSPIKRIIVELSQITLLWTKQLLSLSINSMNGANTHGQDVSNPKYILQWLIGTLDINDDTNAQGTDLQEMKDDQNNRKMVVNRKKIRDCAIFSNKGVWRRSGAWFGLKQSLHSHFAKKYKFIIVHFMSVFLSKYSKQLNATQKHEAIIKIERRIKKLQKLAGRERGGVADVLMRQCKKITQNVFEEINKEWQRRMESEHTDLSWRRVTGDKLSIHKFPRQLIKNQFVDYVYDESGTKNSHNKRYKYTENIQYHKTWRGRMDGNCCIELLIEFENDILRATMQLIQQTEEKNNNHIDDLTSFGGFNSFEELYNCFNNYSQSCQIKKPSKNKYKNIYSENPYYYSRTVLTTLNILVVFHIKNIIHFGKDYAFGEYSFPPYMEKIFDILLFNNKLEVTNAAIIKDYICQFRKNTQKQTIESIVTQQMPQQQQQEEKNKETGDTDCNKEKMNFMTVCQYDVPDKTPNKSFDIKFGEKNEAIQEWIDNINKKYENDKKLKEKEIETRKSQYQQLQTEIKTLQQTKDCQCYTKTDGKTKKSSKIVCQRCSTIDEKRAAANNLKITILEKFLPENKNLQHAIAFDVLMPPMYAMLRNIVFKLESLLFENRFSDGRIKYQAWYYLLEQRQITANRDNFTSVHMARSSNSLYSRSSWATFSPDSEHHCTKKLDSFFVECECKVDVYRMRSQLNKLIIPKITSYELNKLNVTNYSSDDIKCYKSMQDFLLKSNQLTQNDVLCKQDNCPSDMTLNNYIAFGSMKRQPNLVLNQILIDITQKKLKWNMKQTVLLILQALWQGLPDCHCNSYEFLHGADFCGVLLDEIDKHLNSLKINWEQHYALLCMILVLRRFVEFSNFSKDKGLKLLVKCRIICVDWIKTIEHDLGEAQSKIANDLAKSVDNLRRVFVFINIIESLTFFDLEKEFEFAHKWHAQQTADKILLDWIICINNIYENFKCVKGDYLIKNLQDISLLNRPNLVRNIIIKHLDARKVNVLNNFIIHKWKRRDGTAYNFKQVRNTSQFVYESESGNLTLQIDVECGMFLINGTSVSRLPPKILKNEDFQLLFPKVVLEVIQCKRAYKYQTKYPFQKYYFTFEYIVNSDRVIINQFQPSVEENEKSEETEENYHHDHEYIFISQKYIRNLSDSQLPSMMINLHWHWYDVNRNLIQFRVKSQPFEPISNESIIYDWFEDTNVIKRRKDKYCLVNTKIYYSDLVQFFTCLEYKEHIYVWQITSDEDSEGNCIYCELPRFYLSFELLPSENLKCIENKLLVDRNQGLNTLVSLENKLVLRSSADAEKDEKKVIVPYGDVRCEKNEDGSDGDHHRTKIVSNNDQERQTCYSFTVDGVLKCLRAADTIDAWCYLALLHAKTSYILCDEFTKMTGVESCVHWLQNQCMPFGTTFSEKAMKILNSIANISPERECGRRYRYDHAQEVNFNPDMSSYAQFDGYFLLVSKIDSRVRPDDMDMEYRGTQRKLNVIEYMRNSELYSNLCVNSIILDEKWLESKNCTNKNISFTEHNIKKDNFIATKICDQLDDFAEIGVKQESMISTMSSLKEFEFCDIDGWDDIDILKNWFGLYQIAQCGTDSHRERLKMFISYKLFENTNRKKLNILLRLKYVCDNWQLFNWQHSNRLKIPENDIINNCGENWFDEINLDTTMIDTFCSAIGRSYAPSKRAFNKRDTDEFKQRETNVYKQKMIQHTQFLSSVRREFEILKQHFDKENLSDIVNYESDKKINETAMDEAQSQIEPDEINIDKQVVKAVCQYIKYIETMHYNRELWRHFECINNLFKGKNISNVKYHQILKLTQPNINDTRYCLRKNQKKSDKCLLSLGLSVRYDKSMKMEDIQPLLFLQNEFSRNRHKKVAKEYLALGMELWTKKHKLDEHPDHGWKFQDFPEWLAFEIVEGKVIRKNQISIAFHLLQETKVQDSDEEDSKSQRQEQKQIVTQLNMGQGKTSVILPIMALYLSNGIDRVSRIILLRSLFATNLRTLHGVFGVLGRCVYTLHCHRSTKLKTEMIYNDLDNTLKNQGTLIATSEEIMSFNLKVREHADKAAGVNSNDAHLNGLLKCQEWLNTNVQSILDEADEILHPRNQLIYPTGNPCDMDGKFARWRTCMAIFEALYDIIDPIYQKYGKDVIQYRKLSRKVNVSKGYSPYIRLIKEDCYDELVQEIVKYIIDAKCQYCLMDFIPNWTEKEQSNVIELIGTRNNIEHNANFTTLPEFCQTMVLELRGVLYHGCLLSVLKKRHEIDYGLPDSKTRNEKNRTEMAVPYRAKNIASEQSDFSHADIAILNTLLSYYYNGLNEKQMHSLFNYSKMSSHYDSWIKSLKQSSQNEHTKRMIRDLPQTWEHVNLCDEKQTKDIFKVLYNFLPVVNFYCDEMIFPHYCKQFEFKYSNSPWDLSKRHKNYITTGFAGTNGLQSIYPISMKQNDLQMVEDTNADLDKRLCNPYKNIIECIDAKNSGISVNNINDINKQCNVLLDCGGIVEFANNYSFAKFWLDSRNDKTAIIYFDTHTNTLKVLESSGMILDFETSFYKTFIPHSCLIFLDQFHTRGTDLKLPKKSLACITLGSGLTRDALAQGAMRLRQLAEPIKFTAQERFMTQGNLGDFRFDQEFIYLAPYNVFNEIEFKHSIDHNNDAGDTDVNTAMVMVEENTETPLESYLKVRELGEVYQLMVENDLELDFSDFIGMDRDDLDDICTDLNLKTKIKMKFKHVVKMHINEDINGKCAKKHPWSDAAKAALGPSRIDDSTYGNWNSGDENKKDWDNDSVLKWCKNNSKDLIDRMLPIWTNQSVSFYEQEINRIKHEQDSTFKPNYQERETASLCEMYAQKLDKQNVLSIIDSAHSRTNNKFGETFYENIKSHIMNNFDYENILVFHNQESCDDEQERELERETENEIQRQLPGSKQSIPCKLSKNLYHLFKQKHGQLDHQSLTNIGFSKRDMIVLSDEFDCVYDHKNEVFAPIYSRPKNWLLMIWDNKSEFIQGGMFITQHEASIIKQYGNLNNIDKLLDSDNFVWSLHGLCSRIVNSQSMLYLDHIVAKHKNFQLSNVLELDKFEMLVHQFVGNLYFNSKHEFDLFCQLNALCLKQYNDVEKQARNEEKIDSDGFVNDYQTRVKIWNKEIADEQKEMLDKSPIDSMLKMIQKERNDIFMRGSHMQNIIHKAEKPLF